MEKIKYQSVFISLATIVLSGCVGPLVPHVRVDPNSVGTLAGRVIVLDEAQSKAGNFKVVQSLTATSCKNKIWDAAPSNEDATNQLRVKALSAGTNALANLYCETPQGTSLATNCWSSIACHAAAVQLN